MTKFSQSIAILLCSFLVIALASCGGKKGCTDPDAINYNPDVEESADICVYPLSFHFQPVLDGATLTYGGTSNINGLDVRFDQIRFYMTDLELTISENAQTFDDIFIITEMNDEKSLGQEVRGDLTKVAFNVGVPESMNGVDPATLPADNPLSADSPFIQHWNWTAGYKFLVMEGRVDTNGDGTYEDTPEETMSIHCGFNSNLKRIELNTTQTLNSDNHELHLEFDVAKFFAGYDLANNLFSRPNNNPEAATAIMDNVANAFDFE